MNRLCAAALSLAALLVFPARAALIAGPADVATLTARADAVVLARAVRVESGWGEGGEASGVIVTTVTLEVSEWWKGRGHKGAAAIAVRLPGGIAGDYAQSVGGSAQIAPGEEVVVFLRKLAPARGRAVALYDVTRWALGKFTVRRLASGVRVERDRTGLLCQGCGDDEADELSLDELRSRVARALRRPPPGKGSGQ